MHEWLWVAFLPCAAAEVECEGNELLAPQVEAAAAKLPEVAAQAAERIPAAAEQAAQARSRSCVMCVKCGCTKACTGYNPRAHGSLLSHRTLACSMRPCRK